MAFKVSYLLELQDRFSRPARNFSHRMKGIRHSAALASDNVGRAGKSMAFFGSQAGQSTRLVGGFSRGMVGAAAAVGATAVVIAKGTKASIDFESAMVNVSKVSNLTGDSLKRVENLAFKLSKRFAIGPKNIAEMFAEGFRANVAVGDMEKLVRLSAMASTTFDNLGETDAVGMIARFAKLSDRSIPSMERLLAVVNELGNTMPLTESDVLRALQNKGLVAGRTMGFAAEQTAILAANIRTLTGAAPERIGAFMQRISAVLSSPKRMAKVMGTRSAAVFARDFSAKPVATFLRLFENLGKLEPGRRSQVLEELFGLDFAKRAEVLAIRIDEVRKSLGMLNNTQRLLASFAGEYTKKTEASQFKLDRYSASMDALSIAFGNFFKPSVTTLAENAAANINKITESLRIFQSLPFWDDLFPGVDLKKYKLPPENLVLPENMREGIKGSAPLTWNPADTAVRLPIDLSGESGRGAQGNVVDLNINLKDPGKQVQSIETREKGDVNLGMNFPNAMP